MFNLNLVIFDMDGLLFDTELPTFQALKNAAKKAGFDFSIETYRKMIGVSKSASDKIMFETHGQAFLDNVLDNYRQEFQNIINTEGIKIKPGALELLDVLDQKGIKRCIASSSSRKMIAKYLHMTGLTDRFDFYLSGEEVENGKPAPDIFLEACRRAEVEPHSAIVLEDSYHGFKAATSAEIPCIIVPDLIEPNEEMKNGAYKVHSDLNEVAKMIKSSTT